jgi:glycerophosphoryl diester phosphodiesterase
MRQPLIIAHRGASAYAPENTRAAFVLAREMGADGFECDVHLSKDGVPVVIHDDNLKRVSGINVRVASLPLRLLKKRDIGSWFARGFSDQRILTLEETLALAGPRFTCMVEVKDSEDLPRNERAARNERLTLEVARLLNRAHATACSFNSDICAKLKEALPRLHVDWIVGDSQLIRHNLAPIAAKKWNADGISTDYRNLTAARVSFAHAAGLRIGAWTVNRAASVRRLASMGVDAIETDKPDGALRALGRA